LKNVLSDVCQFSVLVFLLLSLPAKENAAYFFVLDEGNEAIRVIRKDGHVITVTSRASSVHPAEGDAVKHRHQTTSPQGSRP